eukprot:1187202-Prorocentrum_minimum.AAC.1
MENEERQRLRLVQHHGGSDYRPCNDDDDDWPAADFAGDSIREEGDRGHATASHPLPNVGRLPPRPAEVEEEEETFVIEVEDDEV